MKITIKVELYSHKVILVTTYKEFKRLCPDAIESHLYVTKECDSDIKVLVTDKWDDTSSPAFIQCLSHELNHAAMCILGAVAVEFNYDNQEALCYLQDFLMRKALDKLAK